MIVNALRGLVKSAGGRLPACSPQGFQARAEASIPPTLTEAARPLLNQIAALNTSIQQMDRGIEHLGNRYPEIPILRTVPDTPPQRLRPAAGDPGIPPQRLRPVAGDPGTPPQRLRPAAGDPGIPPQRLRPVAGDPGIPPQRLRPVAGDPGIPPQRLRPVAGDPGIGPLIAAAYVLTLDRPDAVQHSRQAGAFLGLRPRQSQSGDSDPQHRISKTGNVYLRSLLVQAAHCVLGRFEPDSELRRWGLKLAASGGKRGKKRAIVAVARKLAVILHRIWQAGNPWQAFPQSRNNTASKELRMA